MRGVSGLVISVFVSLFSGCTLTKHTYVLTNAAYGGSAGVASLAMEAGRVIPTDEQSFLAGIGFAGLDTSQKFGDKPSETAVQRDQENELYGALGIRVWGEGLFLVVTAGISIQETKEILHTPSGVHYVSGQEEFFTGSGGLRCFFNGVIVELSYHNRRGPTIGVGIPF